MIEHFVKSVVLAKSIMDDYDYNTNTPRIKHFALVSNEQWGRFVIYQESFNDVEFMGLQRGDEILCFRETQGEGILKYGIDRYLTYPKIEQNFISKQKQH